jgi:hypothetical protein
VTARAAPRPPGEAAFCWAMVLLGAFVTWQGSGIGHFDSPSAAGVFPVAAGGAMTLAALVAAVSATRRAAPGLGPVLPRDVAAIGVLVLGYMAGLESLGFVAASLAFLFLAILWLQRGRVLRAGLVAALAVAVVWVVFRMVFRVVLPQGWVFA